MGDHENGSAVPRFASQPFCDEAHILPVKAAGGLIKNQYPAAGKDGAGDGKTLETSEGVFQSRTVVIATGATPRPLGIPGEEALVGKGVHYCAACDGAPYRGKTVTVVGGGNSAAADALALARYVHFDVRASRRSRKQIQPISSEKIEICLVRFKSISSREHIHYFRKPA